MGILMIGDEAQMQMRDLLDGLGRLGQRGQSQPVVGELAFGRPWGSRGRRRQAQQAVCFQAFDADVG